MSLFLKQIHQIEYQDLKQMMAEGTEENIRLEFKRDYPGKSNLLKKISAFANTYGGFIILGVEEDGKGRIKSLPGIDKINRFDQTVMQWCFEEIYPPLVPYVSPSIPHPDRPGKFFYVIYIEQSLETPHLLNKSRNGLYVRTDEYSQKFLTRLAKFDELEYLMNKRKKAEDSLTFLLTRAQQRLSMHKLIKFDEHHGTDALLKLCLIPFFSQNRTFSPSCLVRYAQESTLRAREIIMPDFSDEKLHSQFESIISENPGIGYYSYFEINIYNMLYYVGDVTREYPGESPGAPYQKMIPTKVLMAEILLFLRYAQNFYKRSGFDGMLKFIAGMENIKNKKLKFEDEEDEKESKISYLDNSLELSRAYSAFELRKLKPIALDAFKELCFSLGFKKIYALPEEEINKYFVEGLRYLGWKEETDGKQKKNKHKNKGDK